MIVKKYSCGKLKSLFSAGECYIKLNHPEDAIKHLKKAIELTKNEASYLTLAKLYVSQDRITDAVSIYIAASKLVTLDNNIMFNTNYCHDPH